MPKYRTGEPSAFNRTLPFPETDAYVSPPDDHEVIAGGSRHWRNWELVRAQFRELPANTVIIHGGQVSVDAVTRERYGADYICGEVAKELGFRVIVYPADWKTHGRAAGPIRNALMYDRHPNVKKTIVFIPVDTTTGYPVTARGTANNLHHAQKRGIPSHVVYDEWWID